MRDLAEIFSLPLYTILNEKSSKCELFFFIIHTQYKMFEKMCDLLGSRIHNQLGLQYMSAMYRILIRYDIWNVFLSLPLPTLNFLKIPRML